jgi:hypothetical protein
MEVEKQKEIEERLRAFREFHNKTCRCGCHFGREGNFHCFGVCCDFPDQETQRGCFG